jgi:F-type H+-transporting ATPase subunit delta
VSPKQKDKDQGEPGPRQAPRAKPGSRVLADRYGKALLEVALEKETSLDRIGQELEEFEALLERESALRAALTTPTLSSAKRVEILASVLKSAKLAEETVNLLLVLARNERVSLVSLVAESFRRQVLEHKKIQPGDVISAHPLSSDQKKRLAGQLGQALEKTMELTYRTDPEILGGVVVRVGNRIFDASVTTQLRRFKEEALSRL